MTAIHEDLAFDVVVFELIDLFLKLGLDTVGSDDCKAIEGLREVSVASGRLFLHHASAFSLTIKRVVL